MIALQNVDEISTYDNEVHIEFEYDDWNLGWSYAYIILKPHKAKELVKEIQKALLEIETNEKGDNDKD